MINVRAEARTLQGASSHADSLGRTFNRQDEPASAAEGCLSGQKKCPQGLKPVLHRIVNVRAEARLKPVPFKA